VPRARMGSDFKVEPISGSKALRKKGVWLKVASDVLTALHSHKRLGT
jgi:hypothetical protein